MPKKVKTKKQKLQADLRRKNFLPISKEIDETVYSISDHNNTATQPKPNLLNHIPVENSKSTVSAIEYPFLINDLRKTVLLTIFIAISQLAIKFLLKI
jgi:hypothetical protein